MRRILTLMFGFVGMVSCAAVQLVGEGESLERPDNRSMQPMEDVWGDIEVCYPAWSELISEWVKAGGGIKKSMMETRKQIESDPISRFARFVRVQWESQTGGAAHLSDDFGAWPLPSPERLYAGLVCPSFMELDDMCQSISWLNGIVWEEFFRQSDMAALEIEEAPDSMEWDSPYVQQWVVYWLLVKP